MNKLFVAVAVASFGLAAAVHAADPADPQKPGAQVAAAKSEAVAGEHGKKIHKRAHKAHKKAHKDHKKAHESESGRDGKVDIQAPASQ